MDTSFVLELLIYPVIFAVRKGWRDVRSVRHEAAPVTAVARIRTER